MIMRFYSPRVMVEHTYSTTHEESANWIELWECLQGGEPFFGIRIEMPIKDEYVAYRRKSIAHRITVNV